MKTSIISLLSLTLVFLFSSNAIAQQHRPKPVEKQRYAVADAALITKAELKSQLNELLKSRIYSSGMKISFVRKGHEAETILVNGGGLPLNFDASTKHIGVGYIVLVEPRNNDSGNFKGKSFKIK